MRSYLLPLLFLASMGQSLASTPPPAYLEVASKGEPMSLRKLLVPGRRTILFMYSAGLTMIPDLLPFLKRMTELDPRINVRVIDIDRPGYPPPDFQSPFAKRNRITPARLPLAQIYSPRGQLESRDREALSLIETMARSLPPPRTGAGPYPPEEMTGPVREITHGNDLDLKPYLSKDSKTIVMFHSPFCPPCRQLRPSLEELARRSDEYVIREVNVNRPGFWGIDYQSPVMRSYGLRGIPYVLLYDRLGEIEASGPPATQRLYTELLDMVRAEKEAEAREAAAAASKAPGAAAGEPPKGAVEGGAPR